jgi:hypothetical protein
MQTQNLQIKLKKELKKTQETFFSWQILLWFSALEKVLYDGFVT